MVPRPEFFQIKKTVGPSGGAHGLLVNKILYDHGRLAPSLEQSHHQFLSAFEEKICCLPFIKIYFKECVRYCQLKYE